MLIVEDEMLLAMDYEANLKQAGCTVLGPVPRASKAIALLEGQRPDVAILDLNLGGHRPTALAEALVEKDVPFLIVSGYSEQATQEAVFRSAPRLAKALAAGPANRGGCEAERAGLDLSSLPRSALERQGARK